MAVLATSTLITETNVDGAMEAILERVPCIRYPVRFRKDEGRSRMAMSILMAMSVFDSQDGHDGHDKRLDRPGSGVNASHPAGRTRPCWKDRSQVTCCDCNKKKDAALMAVATLERLSRMTLRLCSTRVARPMR